MPWSTRAAVVAGRPVGLRQVEVAGAAEEGLDLGDVGAAVRRLRADRLLDLHRLVAEQVEEAGAGLPGAAEGVELGLGRQPTRGSRGLRCSAASSASSPNRLSNHPIAELPQVGMVDYRSFILFCVRRTRNGRRLQFARLMIAVRYT